MRFLQLLCENHNLDLQQYLRDQNNKTNYDLVSETLRFLDCICGSTTGVLGLLGLYINKNNVELIKQALETLTEYCQGSGKIQTPDFIKNIFYKKKFLFIFTPKKALVSGINTLSRCMSRTVLILSQQSLSTIWNHLKLGSKFFYF